MKKVSAFSVFKAKKKGDTPTIQRSNSNQGSLWKASSVPAISEEEKKGNKLFKAFKGGSFRNTMRGKGRPKLGDGVGNSPFVAGDAGQVKLTSVKTDSKHSQNFSQGKGQHTNGFLDDCPEGSTLKKSKPSINGHAPLSSESLGQENIQAQSGPIQETPKIGKKGKNQGTSAKGKSPKQKKPLPPLPADDLNASTKRPIEEETSSSSKRRKPNSAPVQSVVPLKKAKLPQARILHHMYDSSLEATNVFECMIRPVLPEQFFNELWQKKPLLVKRHIPDYNDGWFSTQDLNKILKEESVQFGVNLDVTTYTNGKRETHNPVGRAYAPVVWDYYQNGCSVRLLNPQTYSHNVWKLLSTLQEYFGCCVGANIYLTPPGTQGFAPHYDDIEAFILQLEGKKHWRLYSPRTPEETLPRTSSGNFSEDEIGEPILDVTLQAGDLLYFPRGTIHQGKALQDSHSLHITVSCFQKNTWGDLLEKLVPRALELAIEEDVEFREGLPRDYLNYMGLANSDVESPERQKFLQRISYLLSKLTQNYAPVDASCDQMGKSFIHDSLPPVLDEEEKACSIHGTGEWWDPDTKQVRGTVELEPDTCVKFIRKGAIRLVTEDDAVRVYHNLENARVYHGNEHQFIDITAEIAPAVEFLIHSYPEYVPVDSLPLPSVDERVNVASILYDKGLLLTEQPLQPDDDEGTSDTGVVAIQ